MSQHSSPVLELRNISRIFDGRRVVNDVSLHLAAGEVMALLGPSGCGKSTTLRIASGVDRQDEGSVLLDGEVISSDRHHLAPEKRGIGLMFQDFGLFPHLSVGENVGFGLARNGQRKERIAALLAQMNLAQFTDRYPHQLSGGEQQRVALARALAPRPKVLLMDEPFSGLDNRLRDAVRDSTLDVLKAEKTAVIIVTHDPEEAMRFADKIALMRVGSLVQEGNAYQMFSRPIDRQSAGFFSDLNVIEAVVESGFANTHFGSFPAPDIETGKRVEIAIRPQHVRIDFDRKGRAPIPTDQDGVPARGRVRRARFLGDFSLVEFDMDYGPVILRASVPEVFLPKIGTVFWLSLRRERCHLFAKPT